MEQQKFEIGDVVLLSYQRWLSSTTIYMTVTAIDVENDNVSCTWFNGDDWKTHDFTSKALKIVKKGEEIK